jgi:hypothetical protein
LSDVIKKSLLAKMPPGALHAIAPGLDEDRLYDGIAEDYGTVKDFLNSLKDFRNPYKTTFLDSLEKEYGILKDPNLSEDQRRANLASLVYATRDNGSLDGLQDQLHAAGFTDLFVYDNSPAVDPDIFVGQVSEFMCADPPTALCADPPIALCSLYSGGEYVVNGDIYEQEVSLTVVCSDPPTALCANPPTALCGDFINVKTAIEYDPSTNWNCVFFVGGAVTRDGSGAIIAIESVPIELDKRLALRRIILRVKPLMTWGALAVQWTASEVWQDTIASGELIEDTIASGEEIQDTVG